MCCHVVLYNSIICPIAIPQHGTDYQISFCVSVYVCMYVSVGMPTVAFFNQSSRNLARTFGAEKEEQLGLGRNPKMPSLF